jgi:hypothetical protein
MFLFVSIEARGQDFATRNFVADAPCLPSGELDSGFALERDFGERPGFHHVSRHLASLFRRPGAAAFRPSAPEL